jgi:hypothetical protein
MAETFWLWNVALEGRRLTFFATRGNVPCIAKGTKEMVAEMVTSLGWAGAEIRRWSVERAFRSDWHAQLEEDDPGASWEDVWMPTWELHVELSPAWKGKAEKLDRSDSIGCHARDRTWDGKEPRMPCDALIAATFGTERAAAAAAAKAKAKATGGRVERRTTHPKRLFVWLERLDAAGFEKDASDEVRRWRKVGASTRYVEQ